jgi:hypothetical protein
VTRIDGKGGSRIVPCPECGAPAGEHCKIGGGRAGRRVQSHAARVGKAHQRVERIALAQRVGAAETAGMKLAQSRLLMLAAVGPPLGDVDEARGFKWMIAEALDRVNKLIRTRGAR